MNSLLVDPGGTEDRPLKIPKEVWLLVDHLFTQSCNQVSYRDEADLPAQRSSSFNFLPLLIVPPGSRRTSSRRLVCRVSFRISSTAWTPAFLKPSVSFPA